MPTSGPFSQAEWILRFGAEAERCRFDDIWLNDHLNFGRSQISHSPAGTLDSITDESEPSFFESVTTAALLAGKLPAARGKRAGAIVSGGNIDLAALCRLIG
jgi:hypothetical protein